jgi:DNA modification methylase
LRTYPDDFKNKIIQGECIDVMRDIPDGVVDLVLTDPPYGINEAAGKNKSRCSLARSQDYGNAEWDSEPLSREQFETMQAKSANQIIFGGNYFDLPPSPCWLVWDKENGATDFADCELAWTSFKSAVRLYRWKWQGMLQGDMKNKDVRVHPTQKPLALMRWIVSKYSKPGEIILDPFAGSGTTCLAAKQLGRDYIGIEFIQKYCKIAEQRLAQEELF